MKKSGFLKGAMILSIAGILVKVIGAVNKIIIARILGGEGMGLYQIAYSIFNISASIATMGIPVALSIIVAEYIAKKDYYGAKRIYKIALTLVLALSISMSVGIYYGAEMFYEQGILYDPRTILPLKLIAFAIPFVAIMALYRGFFQGQQFMLPIGISQVLEQSVRVVSMITLSLFFIKTSLDYAAAGAVFANFPAAVAAVIVLLYFYRKNELVKNNDYTEDYIEEQKSRESTISLIKKIMVLAIPMFIVPVLMPLMAFIDTIIVPARLEVMGLKGSEITAEFGYLTGMASSLVNLPIILTTALATSLVPAISEAKALNLQMQISERSRSMMKLATLITFPAAMGMIVLAKPISMMLYATPKAGMPLAVLSLSMIFLGWQQITTSILQGLGYTQLPTINLIVSMFVKVILTWYLTAKPSFGILGAALATDAIFALAFALNLYFIYKYTEYRFNLFEGGKILLSTLLMGIGTYTAYYALVPYLGNTISVLIGVIIAITLYVLGILLFRAVSYEELIEIPFLGNKIKKYADKTRGE